MDKTITFGIPCYNSASYMDHCIESILKGSNYAEDVQIVIVDDGSFKDNTAEKADEWAQRYPEIIDVVHQENGGHGIAVLSALAHAKGAYFKIVDSDDWLDAAALMVLLVQLREFLRTGTLVDLVITNYVFEHVEDNTHNIVDYRFNIPSGKVIKWNQVGRLGMTKKLMMHALCYRTEILRAGGLPMPAHTFYVDNIYAYVPLPRCKTLYYLDVDLYRYYIGREDQSVNEEVMIKRIDQHMRVTEIMMRSYHLYQDVKSSKLRNNMLDHLSLMLGVANVISTMSDDPEMSVECQRLWDELEEFDERMYKQTHGSAMARFTSLPTKYGELLTIGIYHAAAKLVKFN